MSTDQNEMHALPNIVLVHGAWADGSSWSGSNHHRSPAGHLAMVSHPAEVADLTEAAAARVLAVNAVQ
jgi:hypothetical protein